MDTSYYFVLEPDGIDDGPYRLHEIQRRIDVGLISRQASLCKTGDTTYVPLTDPRFAEVMQPPKRQAAGTGSVPVIPPTAPTMTAKAADVRAAMTPPPVAAMPPGFVPPVATAEEPGFTPVPSAPVYSPPVTPTASGFAPTASSAGLTVPSSTMTGFASGSVGSNGSAGQAQMSTPSTSTPSSRLRGLRPSARNASRGSAAPPIASPAPVSAPSAQESPAQASPSMAHQASPPMAAPSMAHQASPSMHPAPAPMPRQAAAPQAPAPHNSAPPPAAMRAPLARPAPAPIPQLPAPSPESTYSNDVDLSDMTAPQPHLLTPSDLADGSASFATPSTSMHPSLPPPSAQPQLPPPSAQPQLAQQQAQYPQPQQALQQQPAQHALQQQPQHALQQQQQHALQQQPFTPPAGSLGGNRKKQIAIAAGIVGVLGAGAAIALTMTAGRSEGAPKDAIVRVTTRTGAGTGFLIQGPDRYAYVATANHVVDRGERVLVERDVGADGHTYVEAYPETEIVAVDADADLAIIRIKNVDASRFARLPLATKPTKDEKILSYGYPGSSLALKPGLVSKDGKVLSLVSFPAYDDRYARILRDNAVDGLLISTDVEQGMSGGPTVNTSGHVVGINVTKDRAHVGQNGAVSVVALRDLLAKVKPAAKVTDPKNEDVVALLNKIQTEYLLLPVDERARVRETDFMHPGDLPNLRELVNEVRPEERNTDTTFIAKYQLSGQAALGMFFARLPGKLLETYRAPSTTTPLLACELSNQRLTSFLGDLTTPTADDPKANINRCDELAVRPLAWDLVAATLQWDGKERTYSVTKLEKMDEDGKIFRASLRISGASNLVELWLGVDQDRVRLKLFDTVGNLYAIKSPRSVPASSFQGTWSIKRPRVTDSINKDAEVESSDTVSISITDDRKVSIRTVTTEHYVTAASGRGGAFRCSGRRTIDTGMVQSFTGSLDNGVIMAFPDKAAEDVGADGAYCKTSHKPDRIVAFKLEGDQLTFYRTDGNAYPETVQLKKDVAAPAPAADAK